jgi:hypothetical protein
MSDYCCNDFYMLHSLISIFWVFGNRTKIIQMLLQAVNL